MSDILSQAAVEEITGFVRPHAQARVLRELGYIVLGVNGRGAVRALANHPNDPSIVPPKSSARGSKVDLKM